MRRQIDIGFVTVLITAAVKAEDVQLKA